MTVGVIIPILHPDPQELERILRPPASSISGELRYYVLDSADDSMPLSGTGVEYMRVPPGTFDHGGTRNLGANRAMADGATVLVFMTQDAVPADERWLERLTAPIGEGQAAATFARQLPRPEAPVLERFSRFFNYPDHSRSRTAEDIARLGVKAFFYSNVCSAVRADRFRAVGGFPEQIIMNEDMALCARLLRAGDTVRYVAEAQVIHSHSYSLVQQFRRNFDVGAYFASAGPELAGAAVGGEGLRFVRSQLAYVIRRGYPQLIPLVVLEAATKFTAFQLGRHHRWLPRAVKKRLSLHAYHWSRQ